MVILHGMRDHALSMGSISTAFMDEFRVVVPDLRGHGDSDNPGSYTIVQFIADLRAMVVAKKLDRPVLVAHSLGGHIASKYAAIYPEEVRALVLIDGMGPPHALDEASRQNYSVTRWREHIESSLQISSDRRVMADEEEAFGRLSRNNPKLAHKTARLIVEHGIETVDSGVSWKWDPAVSMVWSTFDHFESEDMWRQIECPVQIVTGSDSMQYWTGVRFGLEPDNDLHERETERRRRLFKDARHTAIDGAGHMIHYDQPDALNDCLRAFLNDLS
jgi:pimeloyl-ACP methyl ester carboxylesterase